VNNEHSIISIAIKSSTVKIRGLCTGIQSCSIL